MSDAISAGITKEELDRIGQTLQFYAEATGKTLVQVLNRAARQEVIFTIAKTPRVDPGKIAAELSEVTEVQIRNKRTGALLKNKKEKRRPLPLAYAILMARANKKGEKIPQDQLKRRATRLIAARKSSVAFIAAGFLPAARLFKVRAGKARAYGKPKGDVGEASPGRLLAFVSNEVKGKPDADLASRIAGQPAIEALRDVERDMRTFAEKSMADETRKAQTR